LDDVYFAAAFAVWIGPANPVKVSLLILAPDYFNKQKSLMNTATPWQILH
jgi:hypothetical protein